MSQTIMMIGPTAVPERVLNAMVRPSISHRTPEYCAIQKELTDGMQAIFNTKNDVYMVTATSTGAMEATLQNLFSPGDEVVIPVTGTFSEQFATMADAFGMNTKRVRYELGEAADVDRVMSEVTPDTKGVFIVHNESATGVMHDLEAFGAALKDHNALFISDSVSAAGGIPTKMDDWGLDVLLTGSQKALMSPAGVSFISLSDKAWEQSISSTLPKYYFDLQQIRQFDELNQTPHTSAVYTVFAMQEAMRMIMEEGLDNVYRRHVDVHNKLLAGVKELGFSMFPKDEKRYSLTVNAIRAEGRAKQIVSELGKRGVVINGGLGALADTIIRVGTMGYVYEADVDRFLKALAEIA